MSSRLLDIATKIVIKIFSNIYKCCKVNYIAKLIVTYNSLNVIVDKTFFASILNNKALRLQFIKDLKDRYFVFCDKNLAKLFRILQKS